MQQDKHFGSADLPPDHSGDPPGVAEAGHSFKVLVLHGGWNQEVAWVALAKPGKAINLDVSHGMPQEMKSSANIAENTGVQ